MTETVGPSSKSSRSQRKEHDDPVSLFLRKAYHVVCNCPPNLGGWSPNGTTFIIKDVKKFSEKVIPTVYKHNNFSSFVRQLNFYGFRKIKSELSSVESPFWEFRHPKFVRGRPDLLSEIKRAVNRVSQIANSTSENIALQNIVVELSEKLSEIDSSIAGLHRTVSELMTGTVESPKSESSQFAPNESHSPTANRKRSFDSFDSHADPHDQNKKTEAPPDEGSTRAEYATSPSFSFDEVEGTYDDDDSLEGLINLCSQDHIYEQYFDTHYVNPCSQDCIDFDDFLLFSATKQEQLHPACNCHRSVSVDGESSNFLGRSSDLSHVDTPAPLTANDIPLIMSQLPSFMQARFLEKFAESAGKHFCYMMANPHHNMNPPSDSQYGPFQQLQTNNAACQHSIHDIQSRNIDTTQSACNFGEQGNTGDVNTLSTPHTGGP